MSVRKRISDLRIGKNNPFYGKKHNSESSLLMSKKAKDRKPRITYNEEVIDKVKSMWGVGISYHKISKECGLTIGRISQISKQRGWVRLKGKESDRES